MIKIQKAKNENRVGGREGKIRLRVTYANVTSFVKVCNVFVDFRPNETTMAVIYESTMSISIFTKHDRVSLLRLDEVVCYRTDVFNAGRLF